MESQPHNASPRLQDLRIGLEELVESDLPQSVALRLQDVLVRLHEDLLPRLGGGRSERLVVGIVGPNNAGKSTLFNTLAGATISRPHPTGGWTRRLIAVKAEGQAGLPLPVEDWSAEHSPEGEKVLVATQPDFPAHLILVDTPDFDSVVVDNRKLSEKLARVSDLVVVVVTRHSYHNREVVDYLKRWLDHGRPWLLVYNESPGDEIALGHAHDLERRVGDPPEAVFVADHSPKVASEGAGLVTRALEGTALGDSLGNWLARKDSALDLKRRALAAAKSQMKDELSALDQAVQKERNNSSALLEELEDCARALGRRVANDAMPVNPLLEAFRRVLDRRQGGARRAVRGMVTGVRIALGQLRKKLGKKIFDTPSAPPKQVRDLAELEIQGLQSNWADFRETLLAAWGRHRPGPPPDWSGRTRDESEFRHALKAPEESLGDFQLACEDLIERELEEGRDEWVYQLGVDLVLLLPAVGAGALIISTGGMGMDFIIGGAGGASTLLLDRLSRLLGSAVARKARRRWTDLRGEAIAQASLELALPEEYARLRGESDRLRRLRELCTGLEEQLR